MYRAHIYRVIHDFEINGHVVFKSDKRDWQNFPLVLHRLRSCERWGIQAVILFPQADKMQVALQCNVVKW